MRSLLLFAARYSYQMDIHVLRRGPSNKCSHNTSALQHSRQSPHTNLLHFDSTNREIAKHFQCPPHILCRIEGTRSSRPTDPDSHRVDRTTTLCCFSLFCTLLPFCLLKFSQFLITFSLIAFEKIFKITAISL